MHTDTPSLILRDMAMADPADAGALRDLADRLERAACRRIARRAHHLHDLRARLRDAEVEACLADDAAEMATTGWAQLQADAPRYVGMVLCAYLAAERRYAVARRTVRETREHLRGACRHAA